MTTDAPTIERKAVYIGRRITSTNQLAHFWTFYNEEKSKGYKKQIAPATIGEQWIFQTNEAGHVFTQGVERPKQTGETSALKLISEWTAEDQAAYQHDIDRRFELKMANRKGQFEQGIEPLRVMMRSFDFKHTERAAFIQRVVTELWRS